MPRLDTVSGLVEEDVSRLIGGSPLGVSLTKETLNCVRLNLLQGTHKACMSTCEVTKLQGVKVHLYNIIVKQQPVAMTLDDGDIVSSVGPTEKERAEHDD